MPITVEWDDDAKTIIRWNYSGPWTISEFHRLRYQEQRLRAEVDHRIDCLIDVRAIHMLPKSVSSLFKTLAFETTEYHPETSLTVIVGANTVMRVWYEVFKHLYPEQARRYRFVAQLEDAYTTIAEARATEKSDT